MLGFVPVAMLSCLIAYLAQVVEDPLASGMACAELVVRTADRLSEIDVELGRGRQEEGRLRAQRDVIERDGRASVEAARASARERVATLQLEIEPLETELAKRIAELPKALDELRRGFYCSKCRRPASQVVREENMSFAAHLQRVEGQAIPMTEPEIAAKRREYEREITGLEGRIERARRRMAAALDEPIEVEARARRAVAEAEERIASARSGAAVRELERHRTSAELGEAAACLATRAREVAAYVRALAAQLEFERTALDRWFDPTSDSSADEERRRAELNSLRERWTEVVRRAEEALSRHGFHVPVALEAPGETTALSGDSGSSAGSDWAAWKLPEVSWPDWTTTFARDVGDRLSERLVDSLLDDDPDIDFSWKDLAEDWIDDKVSAFARDLRIRVVRGRGYDDLEPLERYEEDMNTMFLRALPDNANPFDWRKRLAWIEDSLDAIFGPNGAGAILDEDAAW